MSTTTAIWRGSPEKLMERYFDAFLYLANWGSRRLMFASRALSSTPEVARQYCHTDAASVIETSDHVIHQPVPGPRPRQLLG